jgi:hypothetical protein
MQVLRCSISWSVLGTALLAWASPLLAQEQARLPGASDHLVMAAVDVVLTHGVVEADGTPVVPISTESAFTLQKLRTTSGKTTIRLTYRRAMPGSPASVLRTPLDGARVDYDPGSQSTTVFDEDGQRPNPRLSLTPSSPAALGSFDSWFESLVFRRGDVPNRREALERSYGRPAGRVGRFTRYVQLRGDLSEELLVDPVSALAVEVNLVRHSVLETHTTIEYGTTPTGQLVRRRLQSEQLIDAGSGRRSVLSVDFSNVMAEGW